MASEGFALSLDGLKAWCDRNDIVYLFNERLQQLGIPTPLGQDYLLRVVPRPSRNMLTLAIVVPFRVTEDRVASVARAIALANSSTFMGAWVLNSTNGELYFRVTLPTEGVSYDDQAVRFLLQVVIGTVQGMGPRLQAVAVDGAEPGSVLE